MSKLKTTLLFIFILFVVGAGGYFVLRGKVETPVLQVQPTQLPRVEVGKPAPDISLTDFSGTTSKLSDYKGKAVVIDFWAGWCPFCVEEMVELEKAYQGNRNNLVILGIHRTDTESKEKGNIFAQERGVTYPLIVDTDGRLYDTFRQGIKAMPLAVFIDKEGVVREIKFGPKTEEEIQQKVELLLK